MNMNEGAKTYAENVKNSVLIRLLFSRLIWLINAHIGPRIHESQRTELMFFSHTVQFQARPSSIFLLQWRVITEEKKSLYAIAAKNTWCCLRPSFTFKKNPGPYINLSVIISVTA